MSMRKLPGLLMFLTPLIILSGCATRRQMVEARLELTEIRREHQEIKSSLVRMDSLLAAQNAMSRKLNADFSVGMQALQERMSLVESRLADAGALVNKAVETIETRKPAQPDSADTSKTPDALNQETMYRSAYLDVHKGDYDMAIRGFREFLKRYPGTSLSDNALYWIGECYFTQKDYAKSQESFEKLLKDYPQSEFLAAAKLKLAMSLYYQKNKTKAKQYFQEVIKSYPGTDEANQAAEMLKRY